MARALPVGVRPARVSDCKPVAGRYHYKLSRGRLRHSHHGRSRESGHIIPTKAYHRSGEATRRCIKLVYFFDVTDPVSVGDDDGPAGPSSDAAPAPAQTEDTAIKTDPVVKTEPVIKSEA